MYDEQKAEISCDGEDGHFDVAHSPKEKEPGRPQGENNSLTLLPSSSSLQQSTKACIESTKVARRDRVVF